MEDFELTPEMEAELTYGRGADYDEEQPDELREDKPE